MKQLLDEALKRFENLKTKAANLPMRKAEVYNLMATIEDIFNGMREAVKTNNNKWFHEQLFLVKVLMDGLVIKIHEKP